MKTIKTEQAPQNDSNSGKSALRRLCLRLPLLRDLYPYLAACRMFGRKTVQFNLKHYGNLDGSKNPFVPSMQEALQQESVKFSQPLTFSILCPLYNTPPHYLREMLQSVLGQTYGEWQLCLADASDDEHSYVQKIVAEFQKKDKKKRISYKRLAQNNGISANTNAAMDMAKGEYFAILDHDDVLNINALFEARTAIDKQNAELVFSDECIVHKSDLSRVDVFHLKPDYAPDTLRASNYICHFMVFSRQLVEKAGGGFRSEYDGSQDFDMVLRLSEKANHVEHVQKLLYFWRSHDSSVASSLSSKPYVVQAAKASVEAHLQRVGLDGKVSLIEKDSCIFKVDYAVHARPSVTVVLSDCGSKEQLFRCIESIFKTSASYLAKILILALPKEKERYFTLAQRDKVQIIDSTSSESFAQRASRAPEQTDSEYLLFLNSTAVPLNDDWLKELLMFAQRPDVGAVGAKLCDEGDAMRHTGLVLGLCGTVGNSQCGLLRNELGFMSNLAYARNVTAVEKACLLLRRATFLEVGGFDTAYLETLEDVDLCLKLRKAGYVNIFTPFAELRMEEKPECCGYALQNKEDKNHLHTTWQAEFQKGDAYFNRNYSLETCKLEVTILP